MYDRLPITVSAEQTLSQKLDNAKTVVEQLEAWLNFETLKANWYGEEDKVLLCDFLLLGQSSYHKSSQQILALPPKQQQAWHIDEKHGFMIKQTSQSQPLKVVIALSEDTLTEHRKNIHQQLQQVCTKVCHNIAQKHQLDFI